MIKLAENDHMIEKILRKIIAFVVVAAVMLPLMMPQVFAASSVTINTKDSVKGGDTFTVAVTFGGGDIGRVDAQLTYDTDMLTYISGGTSSGNSGYVQLKDAGTDGSIVFNLKFQAITEGNVMLDVSTNEMYNLDEQQMDNPTASKSITIEGNASADAIVDTTEPEDEPAEEDPAQQPIVLEGVDEKTGPNITMIAIIVAAVLLILIVVLAVALKKSKPKNKRKTAVKPDNGASVKAADIDDPASGDRYEESLEGPNSLRNYKNPYEEDKALEEELQRRREEIRQRRYEQRIAAREYAKAQTQVWNEWTLDNDDKRDTDDIEKW